MFCLFVTFGWVSPHLLNTGSLPKDSPVQYIDLVPANGSLIAESHQLVPLDIALVKDSERHHLYFAYRFHKGRLGYAILPKMHTDNMKRGTVSANYQLDLLFRRKLLHWTDPSCLMKTACSPIAGTAPTDIGPSVTVEPLTQTPEGNNVPNMGVGGVPRGEWRWNGEFSGAEWRGWEAMWPVGATHTKRLHWNHHRPLPCASG